MLEQFTVLDLSNVLAGPFCCHQLAHMGARVIKVESVKGDLARQLGASEQLNDQNMGISFLAQNAGKESLTLNLKTQQGKEILKKLVGMADVLVENFRPGVMKRLALDYNVLKKENPQLVYCAISGYGQDGPLHDRPAYDQIIQGIAGVMSITGDQTPMRVGYPIADTIGGLTAAMAICAALHAEPRGCLVDTAMLESVLATMGWVISNYLIGNVDPNRHGNENITSAPSGIFQARDRQFNIAANEETQWQQLARLLKREDLLADSRFRNRRLRKENRYALKQELEKSLATKDAHCWITQLNQAGVPAGALLAVPDILAHSQIREKDFIAHFANVPGANRDIELLRVGFRVNGRTPAVGQPPPQLGRDTEAILYSLGYNKKEIQTLQQQGVVQACAE